MTKGEIAKNYYISGLNCAQAVVLAFEQEMGLDAKTLNKHIKSASQTLSKHPSQFGDEKLCKAVFTELSSQYAYFP